MARVLKMKSVRAPARMRTRSTKKPTATAVIELPAEEVAAEAYALFEARAGQPGDPVSDWLEAERIVAARRSSRPRRARLR